MRKQTRKLLLNLTTGVAIAAAAAVVLTPASVFAAPGTITANVNVRSGPGTSFPVQETLRAGTRVDIGECQGNFCYLTGIDGWVAASYLTRGGSGGGSGGASVTIGGPNGGFSVSIGTDDDEVIDDPEEIAEVCFFERTRYRGASFCLEEGEANNRLRGWNDRISSIDNPEGLAVTVCARENFGGRCRTYTTDASSLGNLDDDISSIEIE